MTHSYKIKVCDNCGEKLNTESDKWFILEYNTKDWLQDIPKYNHKCKDGKTGTEIFKTVTVED